MSAAPRLAHQSNRALQRWAVDQAYRAAEVLGLPLTLTMVAMLNALYLYVPARTKPGRSCVVWPSKEALAHYARCSVRSIYNARKGLEALGVLSSYTAPYMERRYLPRDEQTTRYTLWGKSQWLRPRAVEDLAQVVPLEGEQLAVEDLAQVVPLEGEQLAVEDLAQRAPRLAGLLGHLRLLVAKNAAYIPATGAEEGSDPPGSKRALGGSCTKSKIRDDRAPLPRAPRDELPRRPGPRGGGVLAVGERAFLRRPSSAGGVSLPDPITARRELLRAQVRALTDEGEDT